MAENLTLVDEDVEISQEINEIPIDKSIDDFKNHLTYNDRIIFSTKFGDGKTYFLNKFFDSHKEEFEAIKIFPVNYQVADNEDVFELIKKDILIHLLANDLIEDEDFFDEVIYAQNYLFNKGADIILDILSVVPKTKVPAKIIQKCLKHLRKYKDDRDSFKMNKRELIEKYLEKFEHEKGVAEYDSISELITRIVTTIQDKGKEVVLIIDDLDRIDPAHLFRILNVLTAHIDRDVVLCNEIEHGVGKNKFNFDKIITVFDYENVEKIFHHLYGIKTDFSGYISKFITGNPFEYSLKQISFDFVIESLTKKGIDENILMIDNIASAINNASIRNQLRLIDDFEKEIIIEIIEQKGDKIPSANSFTRFLVLLKRLHVDFESIISDLLELHSYDLFNLLGVGLYFGKQITIDNDQLSIESHRGAGYVNKYKVFPNKNGDLVDKLVIQENISNYSLNYFRKELEHIQQYFAPYIKT